ncbi:hypothetical protein L484_008111 [Morus notabilis]|uniref:Uncharacterized protein n=1 Tax=Morus notabilis TaxID=981085 RepID=W9QFN4_9ROSA|nr:hypothetical protein L484_008111 [Morus notabilis]
MTRFILIFLDFLSLRNLEISNCHVFRRIRISAQGLKRLQLQGCETIEISFDLEELGEDEISPVVQVDYLELNCVCFNNEHPDYGSLINGLLWSCHPKTIFVPLRSMFQKHVIEVRHESRGATAKIEMFRGIRGARLGNFPIYMSSAFLYTS